MKKAKRKVKKLTLEDLMDISGAADAIKNSELESAPKRKFLWWERSSTECSRPANDGLKLPNGTPACGDDGNTKG